MKTKPKFETNADATLDRVRATYSQRGGEYADTWGTCRFHVMTSVAKELGSIIEPQHFRALASAALCDMKNERMTGGWKEDNMIDGIAYDAFLVEEMRLLKTPVIMREPDGMGGADKWRLLTANETIREGDQTFIRNNIWTPTKCAGQTADEHSASLYRRLIS